jgi:hypothetical protein
MAISEIGSQPGKILRKLEALEKNMYFLAKNHPLNFALVAEIGGHRSLEEWRTGLSRLAQIHPLLSARVVTDEEGTPVFESQHTSFPIDHRVVDDAQGWEQALAAEIETPFQTSQAPLARAVLLTDKQRTSLILTAHHSIGDGYSMLYAFRDLLVLLTGGQPEPRPLRDISTQEKLGLLEGMPPNAPPPAPSQRPSRYRVADGMLPSVNKLEFSNDFTASLLRRTREEKTTVHAVLSAAIVRAGVVARQNWKEHGVRLFNAVSIRNSLWEGDERFQLSLAPGLINVSIDDGKSIWEAAREIEQLLAPHRTLGAVNAKMNGLGKLLSLGLSHKELGEAASRAVPYDIMISNLGNVSIPGYLAGWQDEDYVGICTFNGSLRLLYVSHSPVAGLLDGLQELLQRAIA